MRKTEFANGEYYHIYNRGVDKRQIFIDNDDYERFLLCLDLLNDKKRGLMLTWRDLYRNGTDPKAKPLASQRLSLRVPIVKIYFYCLNPNHFHFVIKQVTNKGIEIFMQRLGTSYTMYFNKKYRRSGSLFQGSYKSIHIDSNEYLLYLSAYININNFIHGYAQSIKEALENPWKYSSLPDYLGKREGKLCSKKIILDDFNNNFNEYKNYLVDNALRFREKKEIEKYILE